MGLILDSSVIITAERREDSVEKLLERVFVVSGDQDAALSSVGLTELVHGIYRAQNPGMRRQRESFIGELLHDLTVYPYTKDTAMLAGRLEGEQQVRGVTIPLGDLLIGDTALSMGFSILTVNSRHFRMIPGLQVIQL